MAVDAATFVLNFPEFREINATAPEVIANALAEAATFCDPAIWGPRYNSGVMRKAAHLLCMTPFGENARLAEGTQSVHGIVFEEMLRSLPFRVAVAGGYGGYEY